MNMPMGYLEDLHPDIKRMVRAKVRTHDVFQHLRPKVRKEIVSWIENNIDLSRDKSSRSNGFVDLKKTPYGIDVVKTWEKRSAREMLVSAPPQTGKSVLSWIWPSLWAADCDPGPLLTVYQNDRYAKKTNRLRIVPLMGGIPKLAKELERPFCQTEDQFDFADMYWNFQGAGAPITSIPFRRCVADEFEYWKLANDITRAVASEDEDNTETKFVSNIIALRDRVNTFEKISLIVYCCTPQTAGGPTDDLLAESSGGQWHMVCLKCGHKIPSHQFDAIRIGRELFGGLQQGEDGIYYVCTNPECRHPHPEEVREQMNAIENGACYIHERPELVDIRPSFQWSKLAAPFASWAELLDQRKRAGRSNSLGVKQHFDNAVRGLPFKPSQKLSSEYLERIAKHCVPPPDPATIDEIYFAADTQDNGRWWAAVAFDDVENAWVLDFDFCEDDDGIDEAWLEWKFNDIRYTCGCVDEGGHGTRPRDTKLWVIGHKGLMCYKGDWRVSKTVDQMWKLSTVKVRGRDYAKKRILADARHYQKEVLYRLHHADLEASDCNLYFPQDCAEVLLEHMGALRPDPKSKYGTQLENWINQGRDDHLFDCIKQAFVLRDARTWQRARKSRKGPSIKHRN